MLSVSVKDEKKLLGALAIQAQQQQIGSSSELGELPERDADKKADLALKSRLAESAHRRRLRTAANGYLYDLSNQAQVISLEDLVTLVVLVEDAPLAVKTKAALPEAEPKSSKSGLPEDNTSFPGLTHSQSTLTLFLLSFLKFFPNLCSDN